MNDTPRSSSVAALLVAWLVVLIPAVWGVSQTVYKSMDLFRAQSIASPAPATSPA